MLNHIGEFGLVLGIFVMLVVFNAIDYIPVSFDNTNVYR
jgi:hypothetical protein